MQPLILPNVEENLQLEDKGLNERIRLASISAKSYSRPSSFIDHVLVTDHGT
jgi:hypothetical protein